MTPYWAKGENSILTIIPIKIFIFFILLPATVVLLFIRHFTCKFVFNDLNSWPITITTFFSISPLMGVDRLIKLRTRTESFFTSIYHVCSPAFFSSLAAPASADSDKSALPTTYIWCLSPVAILMRIICWCAPPHLFCKIVRYMLQLTRARNHFVEHSPQTTKEKEAGRFEPMTLGAVSLIRQTSPLDYGASQYQ